MRIIIRKIGNSQGFVIPKPVLAQLGLEGGAEMTIEGDALVLRKPAKPVRAGWAEAARQLAEHGDDTLVMGEFGNEDDAELKCSPRKAEKKPPRPPHPPASQTG